MFVESLPGVNGRRGEVFSHLGAQGRPGSPSVLPPPTHSVLCGLGRCTLSLCAVSGRHSDKAPVPPSDHSGIQTANGLAGVVGVCEISAETIPALTEALGDP